MATAVYPEIVSHSGTASAVYRRRCTSRRWVPRWPTSAAPCATTPCGSYLNGSSDSRTQGIRGSTTTWPVPKPWSTCRSTLHRATPSRRRPRTAPCPCTEGTPPWDPTTCSVLVQRCLLPSTGETWALTDDTDHNTARSVWRNDNNDGLYSMFVVSEGLLFSIRPVLQYAYQPDRRSMPAGIPIQTITAQSLQGKTVRPYPCCLPIVSIIDLMSVMHRSLYNM